MGLLNINTNARIDFRELTRYGGEGSGNHGHKGVKGQYGGSAKKGEGGPEKEMTIDEKFSDLKEKLEDYRCWVKMNDTPYNELSKEDKELGIKRMELMLEELDRMYAEFPKIKTLREERLYRDFDVVLDYNSDLPKGSYRRGVLAFYDSNDRMIRVGMNGMIRTAPELSIGNQHNIGIDFQSTFRHEFGHMLWSQYLTTPLRAEWKNFHTVKLGTVDKYWFSKKISHYAGTDMDEAWAESFSAWTSPLYNEDDPLKSLPAGVEIVLEKLFGERKKK